MPPKPKFTEGERVLCYHGNFIYEAKCVKSDIVKEKSVRHFIHYNGWNKNWDEWVPESRVLKFNDAGLQKQKELKKAHDKNDKNDLLTRSLRNKVKGAKPPKTKKGEKEKDVERERDRERASTPTSEVAGPSNVPAGKRRGGAATAAAVVVTPPPPPPPPPPVATTDNTKPADKVEKELQSTEPKKKRSRTDATIESEDNFMTKIEIKIRIPEELKPWLVDDWDLVTRQKQLVSLPAKANVETVLDDFVKAKLAKGSYPHKDAIVEVTQGLREYFNVMLGTQLLYKFERPQYAEVLADHPDTPMSQIYGSIHLLRLFVKLGGMLAYTQLDERSTQLLMTHLQDLLKYIMKNAGNIMSVGDYYVAPPEYHRKAL